MIIIALAFLVAIRHLPFALLSIHLLCTLLSPHHHFTTFSPLHDVSTHITLSTLLSDSHLIFMTLMYSRSFQIFKNFYGQRPKMILFYDLVQLECQDNFKSPR